MHNFISRDGMDPLELLKAGRAELVENGVGMVNARALDACSDVGFTVTLGNGTKVSARRLIVATGLQDELPNIAGLADHWGKDVLHCPY